MVGSIMQVCNGFAIACCGVSVDQFIEYSENPLVKAHEDRAARANNSRRNLLLFKVDQNLKVLNESDPG